MEQLNATIKLDPMRLNRPLAPLHARRLHSFVARFSGIPEDCTSPICRIFKTDLLAHYDIPISLGGDGLGICYIIGTCLPDVGRARYEIHAYDAHGNMTALGAGCVVIAPFTETGAPIVPGQSVPVMQITDASGALHTISAVPDGMGGYTSIIDADGTEGNQ